MQRKQEQRVLEEKEAQELAKYGKPKDAKVTRSMIEERRAKEEADRRRREELAKREQDKEEEPIPENINHIIRDEYLAKGDNDDNIDARTLEDALSQMKVDVTVDKHPEKRFDNLLECLVTILQA